MWTRALKLSLILLSLIHYDYCEAADSELSKWVHTIKDPRWVCKNEGSCQTRDNLKKAILEAVSCSDPGARWDYKFTTNSKTKLVKNFVMNGAATVSFSPSFQFGMKFAKCLKPFNTDLIRIEGTFVDDQLQGLVRLTFKNDTTIIGMAEKGVLCGNLKFQDEQNNLVKIESISTGIVLYEFHPTLKLGVMDLGDRKVLSIADNSALTCKALDLAHYVDCMQLEDDDLVLDREHCTIQMKPNWKDDKPRFKFNAITMETFGSDETRNLCPASKDWKTDGIRQDLKDWIKNFLQDHHPFWYNDPDPEPLDKSDPKLELFVPQFINRTKFPTIQVEVQSFSRTLVSGLMINGSLTVSVNQSTASLSDWKAPLLIKFGSSRSGGLTFSEELAPGHTKSGQVLYLIGRVHRGKLHGPVVMYGQIPNDPSSCSLGAARGVSFIGNFEHGIPVGTAWKGLIGGAWLYGQVDSNGLFTGEDIVYVYQDVKTALRGTFVNGIMVAGQESEVLGIRCNDQGIKELLLSEPSGPFYHFNPPNDTSYGDQPLLTDPLDKRYTLLNHSVTYPDAGQGTYALEDMEADTIFALYGGLLMDVEKSNDLTKSIKEASNDINEVVENTKYNFKIGYCNKVVVIPKGYGDTSKFRSTLGHKLNHSFQPNAMLSQVDTARFGVIGCQRTVRSVKKGDELLVSYNYDIASAPRWYQEVYLKYVEQHPEFFDYNPSIRIGINSIEHLKELMESTKTDTNIIVAATSTDNSIPIVEDS